MIKFMQLLKYVQDMFYSKKYLTFPKLIISIYSISFIIQA